MLTTSLGADSDPLMRLRQRKTRLSLDAPLLLCLGRCGPDERIGETFRSRETSLRN